MEERLTPGPASRNCSRCHLIRLVAFNLRECRRLRGVLTGREEEEQEEGGTNEIVRKRKYRGGDSEF